MTKIKPQSIMDIQFDRQYPYYLEDGIKDLHKSGVRLSEFNYRLANFCIDYWSKEGDTIIDPFAGRVTRAVATEKLNRNYIGYEISPDTHMRSINHFEKIGINPILHNSNGIWMKETNDGIGDMILTCPPYFNIERYETVPGQLSDYFKYDDFLRDIRLSIRNSYRVVKNESFSCWVVADVRNFHRWGGLLDLHGDIIKLHKLEGWKHWDTIILPYAESMSYQIHSAKNNGYTAKIHEYLLVFRK